jgi:tRNA pseudouridine38-40 synthase
MMLKIAYLGHTFHGFARQPGLRTVEGDILTVLASLGCKTKVYSASRTDKGVSALCNVLRVDFQREDICRILTASLDNIWVYGYTFEDFNPRVCTKHYMYFVPGTYDQKDVTQCCQLFSGIHDFAAFTRAKGNTVREIQVTCDLTPAIVLFHFTGRSFLWEMIRRCMTAMKEYLSGKRTEKEIMHMLEGGTQKAPPAPAENLLLRELECDIPFFIDQYSFGKMQKEMCAHYEFHLMKKTMFAEFLKK